MRNIKKFLAGFILLAFALIPQTGLAQSNQLSDEEVFIDGSYEDLIAESTNAPEIAISIDGIEIEKKSYSPGETIKGSFDATNISPYFVNDVSFSKILAGEYEDDGLAAIFYDEIRDEQRFSLDSGQTKTINFEYTLPKAAGGDLGIQIQLFSETGESLSWKDSFFRIDSENKYLNLIDGGIVKGGEKYYLEIGPTFFEGEIPKISLTIENITESTVNLKPVIEYTDFNTGNIIKTEEGNSFTIDAGDNKEIISDLSRFNEEGGVYRGYITYVNEKGDAVTPKIGFRYIIDGDVATIQSIRFDRDRIKKGESFNVDIELTGKSVSIIETDNIDPIKDVLLTVEITNEKGEFAAYHEEILEYITPRDIKLLTLTSDISIKYPLAKVTLTKDGKILSQLETKLPENFGKGSIFDNELVQKIAYGVGGLVIILILILIIKLLKKDDADLNNNVAPIIVIVFAIIFGGYYFTVNVDKTVANHESGTYRYSTRTNICSNLYGNRISCSSGPGICNAMRSARGENSAYNCQYVTPAVYINYPINVNHGSSVNLQGSMVFKSCSNSTNGRWIFQIMPNGSLRNITNWSGGLSKSNFDSRGHWFRGSQQFSVNLLPQQSCGTEVIPVRFSACVFAGHTNCGYEDGTVTIDNGPCDVCENIPGSQTTVPSGFTQNSRNECFDSCPDGYVDVGDGVCEPGLIASCSLSDNPWYNTTVNISANVTGGQAGGYEYSWSSNPAYSIVSNTMDSVVNGLSLTNYGNHTVTVDVTSGDGQTAQAQCKFEVIDEPLRAVCRGPFQTQDAKYIWQGNGSGGSGTGYDISWSGIITEIFTEFGLYVNNLTVVDQGSGDSSTAACTTYYGNSPGPSDVSTVTLANPITNNTCVANFSATNTGYCDSINLNTNEAIRFFDGDIPEGELPTSGMYKDTLYRVNRWTGQNPGEYLDNQSEKGSLGSTYNIEPSRHVIQCFNIDNYPTASNEFQCILNPDIRED